MDESSAIVVRPGASYPTRNAFVSGSWPVEGLALLAVLGLASGASDAGELAGEALGPAA